MQQQVSPRADVPPPSGGGVSLNARGVSKRYGSVLAVDNVDLSIKQGEILALFGPDGAGKTSLLQMLSGLIKPTSGAVTIYGESIHTGRRRCGYVAQHFTFSQDLSVRENMQYAADLHSVPRDRFVSEMERLLRMVGLEKFPNRLAGKLSGGMKEKLAIACALISNPAVLILDEPTTGVDPLGRREIQHMLVALSRQGTSVLLATSDLEEVEISDRIVHMEHGKLDSSASLEAWHDREQELLHKKDARTKISTTVKKLDLSTKKTGSFSLPDLQQPQISIEAKDVLKRFGAFTAVNGISFAVARGEIFGLLGANGAGKSTAIQMLCGLQRPTEGSVRLLGKDPRGASAKLVHGRMGYMNQRFSLYDGLTVEENIDFYACSYGIPASERKTRVDDGIARLDLGEIRREMVGNLPRGWKQRVAFAAATLHEPEILFLDEPTAGTDSHTRHLLWSLINGAAARGTAVHVTTHYLDEAEFCDRLALMVAGKFVRQGPPAQVRESCIQRAVRIDTPSPQEAGQILTQHYPSWRIGLHPDVVRVLSDDPRADLTRVQQILQSSQIVVEQANIELCSLEEAFIAAIAESGSGGGGAG
jgi:ABC-2 type transport system ATP-binding protein